MNQYFLSISVEIEAESDAGAVLKLAELFRHPALTGEPENLVALSKAMKNPEIISFEGYRILPVANFPTEESGNVH